MKPVLAIACCTALSLSSPASASNRNAHFFQDLRYWTTAVSGGIASVAFQTDEGASHVGSVALLAQSTIQSPSSAISGISQCVESSGWDSVTLSARQRVHFNSGFASHGFSLKGYAGSGCSGSVTFEEFIHPNQGQYTTVMFMPVAMTRSIPVTGSVRREAFASAGGGAGGCKVAVDDMLVSNGDDHRAPEIFASGIEF